MSEGQPLRATPRDQMERRRAYVREHWPELEDDIEREGIVGMADETLWSSFLGMGARCADAVGRISWRDEPAQTRAQGTGFLVANSALLTNWHVIDSAESAADFVVELGYEYDIEGEERKAQVYDLDPERLFLTDQTLDFTLVGVKPIRNAEAGGKRGFLPLISQVGKVRNGESLNLIHHPSGSRKKITIRESRLLAIEETQLQYTGDTLGGSSGSPILNDQWEVVGLHFGGKPKRDEHGRNVTLTGEPWGPGMPDHLKAYEFNVGSRTSRILMNLEKRLSRFRGDKELLQSVLQGGRQ